MLNASNTWPWLAAPSPYSVTQILPVSLYLLVNAMPAPRGTCGMKIGIHLYSGTSDKGPSEIKGHLLRHHANTKDNLLQ